MGSPGTSAADPIQNVERPVVMLSKEYESGYHTGLHTHPRAQFLFAQSGTMRARTQLGSWIVPVGYGLLIPGAIEHDVEMFEKVSLRSAYLSPEFLPEARSRECSVILVSPLLSASIDRFATRPVEYEKEDLAEHLAAIIIAEITQTPLSAMALPLPASSRCQVIADALLNDPSLSKEIDQWASELGMSRRTFTRAFRADTSMSFDQWRQRLRYQAAAELIAKGEPLSHIASKVGYRSAAALKAMMDRHT
ncbi:MAG: helix-turn-helix transcriptional regulator [Sneathiella sp.]